MITLMKETWQLLKLNIKNLLLFETIYRVITVPLYLFLVKQALRLSLRMAGYSYITIGNLLPFLIKPETIFMMLLLLLVCLLFLTIEVGGLLTVYQAAAYHRKVSLPGILLGGLVKIKDEVKKKNWKLLLVIFLHGILIQGFFLYRLFLHVKPLNFILPELGKIPGVFFVVTVIAGLFLWIAINTAFICYGCMVEQRSFFGAVVQSQKIWKTNPWQFGILFVAANVFVVAFSVLLYGVCTVMTAVFAVKLVETSRQMAVLVDAGGRLELFLIFFGGIISMIVNYAVLSVCYYQYHQCLSDRERWDFAWNEGVARKKRHLLRLMIPVALLSLLILVESMRNGFALENELLYETQITAHRGSSKRAPENTLAALEAAIEDMADYAEIDVQETADGVLVLFHDGSFKRIGRASGSVGTMTYQELSEIDAGSWFSPEFAGEKIPTLEEAMELCRGRLNLNIEIKHSSTKKELPQKLASLIEEMDFEEQCVVTSTGLSDLKKVKEQNQRVKTGYILTAAYGAYYTEEVIDFISIRSGNLTEGLLNAAHEQGKAVHVWTVNRKNELERMKNLGVDNIITDDPVYAREILYQTEQTVNLLSSIRLMLEQ